MSLTATPLAADKAERLGFVNHVVERSELLKKARQIAEAIVKNNEDMVLRYKAVINDGFKLDLGRALALEKVYIFLNFVSLKTPLLVPLRLFAFHMNLIESCG